MKIKLFFIFFLVYTVKAFSQGIVVDTTSTTVPQLVYNVLMQNACSDVTNIQYSSHKSIGYFTNTNTSFPITNGIVIRNGLATYSQGQYIGTNLSSQVTNFGDTFLQNLSNSTGQTASITDVAYLQFDFTPISSHFSFDFLFASNEYGQYQCGFSDNFAFLLTDLTTNVTTNLAVIPGTSTPVSVINIRNQAYNSSCFSANPDLFGNYNIVNPLLSATNFRGETKLLKASSSVIPNRTYRIRMVIGDYNDSDYDSAVFVSGGSFIHSIDLGADQAICQGESMVLNTGLDSQYNFEWTMGGVTIPSATSSTLSVNQPGVYGVKATLPNSGCVITDEIELTTFNPTPPHNITVCNTGQAVYQFDLTENNLTTLGLDPSMYSIAYYATLSNANANGPQIPVSLLNSFSSTGNQTIYIKITHISNNSMVCNNLFSFDLLVNSAISITTPSNIILCDSATGGVFDLSSLNATVLNGLDSTAYTVSYYNTNSDAQAGINPMTDPTNYPIPAGIATYTVWIRVHNNVFSSCFNVTSFTITTYPQPLVDDLPNVVECSSYVLPPLVNGNYYTNSGGTGTLLHAGDVITTHGTYYVFNGPVAPYGCTNESSFVIILLDQINFPTTACGKYVIPGAPAGHFYTQPHGLGSVIPKGTILTFDQTIYFYAEINGVVCRDEALNIQVFPLPPVDTLQNVVTCNSFILPTLTNGNYYTETGGGGTHLVPGDAITSSQTIFIYAFNGRCPNETSFRVDIIDTSKYHPIIKCGPFKLPVIPFGNYYTLPGGAGTIIPAGTIISTSQIVYYYAITTTQPNCTTNLNYDITIKPLPPVDDPPDVLSCGSYILPSLTNGNYYTATNGGGTALFPNDVISSTQLLYVLSVGSNGCKSQKSFNVTIRPKPPVDSFTDVFSCTPYTLPHLTNGIYYTATGGPHGSGTVISVGTVVSISQVVYIYNEWPDFVSCTNETIFSINIQGVNVGQHDDIYACESYVLPHLNIGNYYTATGGPHGVGALIPEGTIITTTQTVYIYAEFGGRQTCSDEDSFQILVSHRPSLPVFNDVEACVSYVLPVLSNGNYYSQPNGQGTLYHANDVISSSQIMYVFDAASNNIDCNVERHFFITIHNLKDLVIPNGVICVDNSTGVAFNSTTFHTGLNASIYTVKWYLNGVLKGTGVNFTTSTPGTYSVEIIKNTPNVGDDCGYNSTTATVEVSSQAIAFATVSSDFTDHVNVEVTLTGGHGVYLYQLDELQPQSGTVFYDVDSGTHTITIVDTKGGCQDLQLMIHVLKYPKFFTPNGDGFNDTWNIWDLSYQSDAKVFIYDRYGKLLKEIRPRYESWDGTYNGEEMPSTDYWFQVFYKQNNTNQTNEFKAHFSMKR
ncbi:T9SS type B sorting domain-containing protein [Flavobacterium aciduliphilum]|uniref:Gliding motility-associated-like protein n=1 Tax=Flavobacterium aciduliphilum TaxID=1101402 RepID=A0A328YR32_9FLAO|nr:T9SS type B sorting domain-containing protein [Flavobacterium aciduliphilum]RAR72536.1 gliding motility-associated-like protein [Flavobacterium aciduliphilum]